MLIEIRGSGVQKIGFWENVHSRVHMYLNSWVARDVTKNQTKKLSILLSFYFHEVLQYLNTFT